eukprot:TRINITY_DN2878_c0_g1_i1.p1 TRINITY_DN2878_c0_g1~~TRINITY_DN2878_c0_g1_i1.p1  ORF type:complete len:545 (+),score=67.41 TRINITY_DN2878_c0_g1_i1:103-1737(+)
MDAGTLLELPSEGMGGALSSTSPCATRPLQGVVASAGNSALALFFIVRDHESSAVLKHLNRGLSDPESRHAAYNQDLMFFAAARNQRLGDSGKIARRLADLGVPTNSVDTLHQTPLFFAAREGNTECATFLIHSRCEVNHRDRDGQTALFYAFRSGQIECVHQLVQCKADIGVKDSKQRSAISFATNNLKIELERSLKSQNGPDAPGHPDPGGRKAPASLTSSSNVRASHLASDPKRRRLISQSSDSENGNHKTKPRQGLRSMIEWFETRTRLCSGIADGDLPNHCIVATSRAGQRTMTTRRGNQVALAAAAHGKMLVEAGRYHVRVPPVSRAARLRELECEFVLDHCEMFRQESWHESLQPSEWCGLVNVLYNDDRALQAITNILAGQTPGHQTLECVYSRPDGNPGSNDFGGPKTVGYVHVYCANGHLDISHLKVERIHQRKGLGSLLLAASVKRAEQLGWDAKDLRLVAVSHNTAAVSLYKKLGFRELSTMHKPVRSSMDAKVDWLQMGRELGSGHAIGDFVQKCESNARECMARTAALLT